MKKTTQPQSHYISPNRIVEVITKNSDLKRWPKHGYRCALFLLQPTRGTRVQIASDGRIEWMPTYNELKSLLIAIHPSFAKILPRFMKNKPEKRKKYYDHKNAKWHVNK